jgi:hypothetical protein
MRVLGAACGPMHWAGDRGPPGFPAGTPACQPGAPAENPARRMGLAWGWHGVGLGLAWAEWGRMGTDLQGPWPVGRQVAEVAVAGLGALLSFIFY